MVRVRDCVHDVVRNFAHREPRLYVSALTASTAEFLGGRERRGAVATHDR
jgi:hypothetical protein